MYERAGECAERCPSLQLSAADLSAAKTVRRAAEGQRPAPLQPDRGSNRTRGPRCCPHLASPAPPPLRSTHPPPTRSGVQRLNPLTKGTSFLNSPALVCGFDGHTQPGVDHREESWYRSEKKYKELRKHFQFHYITSHNCLRQDKNKKKRNNVTKYKLDNVNDATKGYYQLHKDICGGKVKL